MDAPTQHRFLNGLDDIGITMQHEAVITEFEAKREAWRPKTLPAKGV
jgi:3-isopropylmalate/(R)-2-methylmalate dehydratase small subunit